MKAHRLEPIGMDLEKEVSPLVQVLVDGTSTPVIKYSKS